MFQGSSPCSDLGLRLSRRLPVSGRKSVFFTMAWIRSNERQRIRRHSDHADDDIVHENW